MKSKWPDLKLCFIVMLVAFNIFWVYRYMRMREGYEKKIFNLSQISNSYEQELLFVNTTIKKIGYTRRVDPIVIDSMVHTNDKLKNELKTVDKIIFVYKKDACASCLIKVYQDLETLSSTIGKENIYVFTNWDTKAPLINPSTYGFKKINLGSFDPELESINQPFVFRLTGDFLMTDIFFPEIFDSHRSGYFNNAKKFFN